MGAIAMHILWRSLKGVPAISRARNVRGKAHACRTLSRRRNRNTHSTQRLRQYERHQRKLLAGVKACVLKPEGCIMTPNDLLRAALPGVIVGCGLWVIGALVGRALGPGWTDVIQGSSFFIGLIWVVVGVRRRALELKRSSQ